MSFGLASPEKTSTSSAGKEHCARIKFVTEPPQHVFADQWFEISISLEMPTSFIRGSLGATNVQLSPELYQQVQGKVSPNPVAQSELVQLIMEESTISLPVGGEEGSKPHVQTARCRLRSPIGDRGATTYCIKFSESWGTRRSSSTIGIMPNTTRPIHVVNAKLKVEPLTDWESTFYKDEGGRDKCMQTRVSLLDKDDKAVTRHRVPIELTLMYDNEQFSPVMKQEILRILNPQNQYIDATTGQATLMFRIEDVSKNHQNQPFVIKVSANDSKYPAIAPCYTASVSVRSKRNKRPRPQNPTPTPQLPSMSSSSHGRSTSFPQQNQSNHRLRQAMKGIITWIDEVVNSLVPLKWTVIGYQQFPDGSVDYNSPYYSMNNPNETVSRLLTMYSDETRENLQVLLSAVQDTTLSSPQDMYSVRSPPEMANPRPLPLPGVLQQAPAHRADPSAGSHYQNYRGSSSRISGMYTPHMPGLSAGQELSVPHVYPPSTMAGPMGVAGVGQSPLMGIAHHDTSTSLPAAKKPAHRHGSDFEQDQEVQVEQELDSENRQADVHYVLAKQFQSLRTNKLLGFPAYSITKELLGFYRESLQKFGAGRFVPISKHSEEFGQKEKTQARHILEQSIEKGRQSVHKLSDWDSLTSMVDHALVYNWTSEEIGVNSNSSGSGEIGRTHPQENFP